MIILGSLFFIVVCFIALYITVRARYNYYQEKRKEKAGKKNILTVLETDADPDQVIVRNKNALILAIEEGSYELVTSILESGADPNYRWKNGETPLMLASSLGHTDIVRTLIKNGADIKLKDNEQQTPLFWASSHGQYEVAEYLLNAGAGFSIVNKNGDTPFTASFSAEINEDDFMSVIRVFLNKGADINERRKSDGTTLLMMVAEIGNADIVSALMDAGADFRIKDNNGLTALDYAKRARRQETVKLLTRAESSASETTDDLKAQIKKNKKILIDAVIEGLVEKVRKLLSVGVNIDFRDNLGYTALAYACEQNHINIVKELIKHKANIELKDTEGVTPLLIASYSGYFDIVKILLNAGADIKASNIEGLTALLTVAGFSSKYNTRNIITAKLLLKHGAGINEKNTVTGQTPLMIAAIHHNAGFVKFLLNEGADTEIKDKRRLTALMHAKLERNQHRGFHSVFYTTHDEREHVRIEKLLRSGGVEESVLVSAKKAKRPWTPAMIFFATALFGPLAGGVTGAINFTRMDKPGKRALSIILGTIITLLEAYIVVYIIKEGIFTIVVAINILSGVGFMFAQKSGFDTWKAANTETPGTEVTSGVNRIGLYLGISFITLAIEVCLILIIVSVKRYNISRLEYKEYQEVFEELIETGRHNDIYNRASCVCFMPDGKRALSGNNDGTIRLWDIANRKELKSFGANTQKIVSICVSPDGKYAFAGSSDPTLKLWDIDAGEEIKNMDDYIIKVTSSCFSPDGKYILTGTESSIFILWDSTGGVIRSFKGHRDKITSVDFSPDSKYALSGSYDRTIKLWDLGTGEIIKTFEGHVRAVNSVDFSPDGKYILSGSSDKTIKLWDIKTGKELRNFKGHVVSVRSICFSPDGRYVLSGGMDGTIRLWDIRKEKEIKYFNFSTGYVKSACLSPDGKFALSVSNFNTLEKWDMSKGIMHLFSDHTEAVYSVCFSPDWKYALSGSGDNTVKLWDIKSGMEIKSFIGHRGEVFSVDFSPDRKYALSGSSDKTMKLWNINTGKQVKSFKGHKDVVWSVCFSPDSKQALSGSEDKTMKLWDVRSGREVRSFNGHKGEVRCVDFSPDGKYALSGSEDSTVRLWSINTGKEIKCFTGYKNVVWSACFSPEGKSVLSCGKDTIFILWDVISGNKIKSFQGHDNHITSVCFSQDGKYAISGSYDLKVKVWDINTGNEIKSFRGHEASIFSADISGNGKYVLSGSGDKTIKLWDIEAGGEINIISRDEEMTDSMEFSGNEKYLPKETKDIDIEQADMTEEKEIKPLVNPLEKRSVFTDFRDGQTYKAVKIGSQWWMAENLNFEADSGCSCFANIQDNCNRSGRLYSLEMAKEVCPVGWHLSTDEEWEQLEQYINRDKGPYNKSDEGWYDLGRHLKATEGWYSNRNGTDDYGFAAIPGGYWNYYRDGFSNLMTNGFWWSPKGRRSSQYCRDLNFISDMILRYEVNYGSGLSVRCVKD